MKLFLISDLHFSPYTKWRDFDGLIKAASVEKPDYITITGDIFNSISDFYADGVREQAFAALERLAKVAPVVAVMGNHEYVWKVGERKGKMYEDKTMISGLKGIPGLTLVRNEWFYGEGVNFYGMELNRNYYYPKKSGRRTGEDLKKLREEIGKIQIDNKGVNILLFHSPAELGGIKTDFDFKISGHMHEGETPDFLQRIWKSDRGLVGPSKRLFPKYARNVREKKLGGIRKSEKKVGEVQKGVFRMRVSPTKQIIVPAWETLPVRPRFWQILRPFYKRKYMVLTLVEKSGHIVEKIAKN